MRSRQHLLQGNRKVVQVVLTYMRSLTRPMKLTALVPPSVRKLILPRRLLLRNERTTESGRQLIAGRWALLIQTDRQGGRS